MGLPPARVKTESVSDNPEPRRRLSQFFADTLGNTEKSIVNPEPRRWLSQFFAGTLGKTEKSGTVPAAWTCANPKTKRCINASITTSNHKYVAAGTVPFFLG